MLQQRSANELHAFRITEPARLSFLLAKATSPIREKPYTILNVPVQREDEFAAWQA
jgi:hypothetical protein